VGDDGESVAATTSPIVNGTVMTQTEVTNRGLAALYDKVYKSDGTSSWFPRPCSAIILTSSGGVSKVLTARHCVTRDVSINGTPVVGADVRVIATAAPGMANPNPPAGAITASAVTAMPTTTADRNRDLAVVTVNANWSANVAARPAVLIANPSTLVGKDLIAYGYGMNINNWSCPTTGSTGAGTARKASPFTITSGAAASDGGSYRYTNSNSSGQVLICGDSGGPDIAFLGIELTWDHITGVHSGADSTIVISTATAKWLQDTLGGLYMSSYWDRNRDAGISVNGPATQLFLYSTSLAGNISRLKYDLTTKRLTATANGLCLDSTASLVTCSSSTSQQWNTSAANMRLVNVSTGKCLTHFGTGGTLLMQACATTGTIEAFARQMFAFHPQL
jgi:hypothetical protein